MDVLDPPVWSAVLSLVAAVAAGVGVLWLWQSTSPRRVKPGPSTMDLRSETPALVDLLTGGFEVEDDAVPATAVDLATRGHYDIEEYGGKTVLRLRSRNRDADDLTPYEERVLRHVRNHAQDGVVPAEVLTIGPDGVSARWYRGFVREVTKHGRQVGLCRRRFGLAQLAAGVAMVVVGVAPAYVVASLAPRTDDPTSWGSIGNLLLGLSLLAGIGVMYLAGRLGRTDSQADTPDGRAAAAHWLGVRDFYRNSGRFEDKPAASVAIWERHLAYATSMGLAPVVQRQLPFETEHDRHAWSRATGHWRRIKVRYQAFRPGWGNHPGSVALGGLIQAVVYGAVAYFGLTAARSESQLDSLDPGQRRWVSLGAVVVAIVAATAAVYAVVKVVIGVADLFPRRRIEGEVVRRRRYRTGHRLPKLLQWMIWSGRDQHGMEREHSRRTRYHLAIDDGSSDRVLAHTVRSEIYAQAPQGARVRIAVSPLLGYVSKIELLSPPPRSAASEAAVLHPVAEEGISTAGATAALKLDEALARAGEMKDETGRPILEQTDDDGVTLAEKLAEGRTRLDELRRDPRIASSPIAGFLDAFDTPPTRDREKPGDGDQSD